MKGISTSDIFVNNLESNNSKEIIKSIKDLLKLKNQFDIRDLLKQNTNAINNLLAIENEEILERICWLIGVFNDIDSFGTLLPSLFRLINHTNYKVRKNAIFAIGRIGRINTDIITPYLKGIIDKSSDEHPEVRHSVIWACENIANSSPDLFIPYIEVFEKLLKDSDIKYVRREAPEIFRVIAKKRPEIVERSIELLKECINDEDIVVSLHSKGVLKLIDKYNNSGVL